MGTDRRGFLQVAGLAGLGLVLAKPAIEVFSRLQPESTLGASGSLSAAGSSGVKLAMAVDIAACEAGVAAGCNMACQTACHLWHNVPDVAKYGGELEEEIKWIWQDEYGKVFHENLIEHVDYENDDKKKYLVI